MSRTRSTNFHISRDYFMNTLLFNIRNLVATMLQPVLRTVDGCRCGMVNSKSYNLVVGAYLFFKSR